MTTSECDGRMAELMENGESLRSDLESLSKGFLAATEEFIIPWAQNEVERAVTHHPEITNRHETEGLRRLKSDLEGLRADMPAIVAAHLDSDERWPHRSDIPDARVRQGGTLFDRRCVYGRRGEKALDPGVLEVVGHVGSLLGKYNYAQADCAWEWRVNAYPRYEPTLDWSPEMDSTVKQYSELFKELVDVQDRLRGWEAKQARAEAKRLWDEA